MAGRRAPCPPRNCALLQTPLIAGQCPPPTPAALLAGDLLKKSGNRYQVCGVSVRPGGAPSGGGSQRPSGGPASGYGGYGGAAPSASQQSQGSKRSWHQAQQQQPPGW